MRKLLRIDASLQATDISVSKQLGDKLVQRVNPNEMVHLDLGSTPLKAIDVEYLHAAFSETPDADQSARLLESDQWIKEVKEADAILITCPMYNFGVPAQLKTFFDLVLRAGHTFKYTESGPVGLVADKPVYLILASGGDYREGDLQALNFLDGHLKTMLNFIGLTSIKVIHAAGLAMGDAQTVIASAESEIQALER